MEINSEKTKSMVIAQQEKTHDIILEGNKVQQVKQYNYLGTMISDNGQVDREIGERIAKVGRIYNALKTTFLGKAEIPKHIKAQVYKKVVRPSLMYGSESWVVTVNNQSRVTATEMRFLRKIEGVTRMDRIRNETITQQLRVKPIEKVGEERQLTWLGHILRMDDTRLTRRIYEARTSGKNRIGRPRLRWEDQVRKSAEMRGIEWREVRNAAQNRNLWKSMIYV